MCQALLQAFYLYWGYYFPCFTGGEMKTLRGKCHTGEPLFEALAVEQEVPPLKWEVVPADCPVESCISICYLHMNVTPVWCPGRGALVYWGKTEVRWSQCPFTADCAHFSNIYNKNLNKEGMHQTESLGIISPVSSFTMWDVNSLVISQNERILITFSLNPFCQTEHAGISMTKEVIMGIFRVSRPKSESFRRRALG